MSFGYSDIILSVCMITYNHEKYIRKAIEGVLSQKCNFPIELIIGEDCSTDNTRSICFEYQKMYPNVIRVIAGEQNVGMIQNLVRVLKAAKGRYIAFCEGDDYWTSPFKIQIQVDFLEANMDFGLCYSDVVVYNQEKNEFENDLQKSQIEINSFEQLILGNYIPTLSVCCRKKYVNEFLEKYSSLFVHWPLLDYPLWLYISYHSKISRLSGSVGVYRVLKESASHSQYTEKTVFFAKNTVEILLIMLQSLGGRIRKLDNVDYEDLFYKQYYSWFIALGNVEYMKLAFQNFIKKRNLFLLLWAIVHLPFWKYPRLPFLIANLKHLI